jgi:hypothetical protein
MKIHAWFKSIRPVIGAVAGLASVLTGCGAKSHNDSGSEQSYVCSFTMPASSTAEEVQQAIEVVNQDHSSLTCPDGMPTDGMTAQLVGEEMVDADTPYLFIQVRFSDPSPPAGNNGGGVDDPHYVTP